VGRLPPLALHRLHLDPDGSIRALSTSEVMAMVSIAPLPSITTSVATRSPPHGHSTVAPALHIALRVGCMLVLGPGDAELLRIPLLLAEVRFVRVATTGAPALTVLTTEVELAPEHRGTWLLEMSCSEACDDEPLSDQTVILRALSALGQNGAVRHDFEQVFGELTEPFAVGTTAELFRVADRLRRADSHGCVAYDATEVEVAVKVFKPTKGPVKMQDVRNEVAILASVQGHPNVIRMQGLFVLADSNGNGGKQTQKAVDHDLCFSSMRWSLAMEHCSGQDLFETLKKQRFDAPEAAPIIRSVLEALMHIHTCGIVHRDIKVENILLRGHRCHPVVADFGLACHIGDSSEIRRICGTPGYVPPEVLAKKGWKAKSDVFALGVVLYFILSGKLPFWASDTQSTLHRTLHNPIPFDRHKSFEAAGPLCREFIRLALCKDPLGRPSVEIALGAPWLAKEAKCCSDSPSECTTPSEAPPPRPLPTSGGHLQHSNSSRPSSKASNAGARYAAVDRQSPPPTLLAGSSNAPAQASLMAEKDLAPAASASSQPPPAQVVASAAAASPSPQPPLQRRAQTPTFRRTAPAEPKQPIASAAVAGPGLSISSTGAKVYYGSFTSGGSRASTSQSSVSQVSAPATQSTAASLGSPAMHKETGAASGKALEDQRAPVVCKRPATARPGTARPVMGRPVTARARTPGAFSSKSSTLASGQEVESSQPSPSSSSPSPSQQLAQPPQTARSNDGARPGARASSAVTSGRGIAGAASQADAAPSMPTATAVLAALGSRREVLNRRALRNSLPPVRRR